MTTPRKTYKLFINGEFVDAVDGKTFPDYNPATGQVIANVSEAGSNDVCWAVESAQAALKGPWGRMAMTDRLNLLRKVADGIEARFNDFVDAEIADTGKPRSLACAVDIPRGAANFRIFAEIARSFATECFEMDTEDGAGAINYSLRVPLGVIGVICPWNLPLLLMTWKVAPALATGNTVVVKPSEETPGTATLLGEVMKHVGVPPGVFNVVHGFGPNSAGQAITEHPGIRAVTFTGETRTGQAIMKASSVNMKQVSFELGGKNPAIIFADADFDKAVAGTARSVFSNCGQVCLCSERVYVERPIFTRFVEAMKVEARKLRPGDPYDPATTIGPLISDTHRQKVLSYYQLAREEGAEVVTGGGIPNLAEPFNSGYFIQPTIFTGLHEHARVVKEEIFGPVCHICPFDSEEEAVVLANNTDYGLCAAVWTQNLTRAHRVAKQLECGIVWINAWFLRDLRTPFGGMKMSGIGREGGLHSIQFYSELKNVCVKL